LLEEFPNLFGTTLSLVRQQRRDPNGTIKTILRKILQLLEGINIDFNAKLLRFGSKLKSEMLR
jgi:hypothetical protein